MSSLKPFGQCADELSQELLDRELTMMHPSSPNTGLREFLSKLNYLESFEDRPHHIILAPHEGQCLLVDLTY
jgi:hypothetical protein